MTGTSAFRGTRRCFVPLKYLSRRKVTAAFTRAAKAQASPQKALAKTPWSLKADWAGLCRFGGKRLGRGSRLCIRVRDHGAKLCYFFGFNTNLPWDQLLKPLWFLPYSGEDLLKHKISRRLCPFSRRYNFNLKDKTKVSLSRGLCGPTPRSFWGRFSLFSAPSNGKLR